MSDKNLDINDPNFDPWAPENQRGDVHIGLDDRTALIEDAKVEMGNFGGQMILTVLADGEEKPWTKYYSAGEKALPNDAGTGFVDEHGNTFIPTKNSEVGQFGAGLHAANMKNVGSVARDVTRLIGHRIHFKEVVQVYITGDKKGKPKMRTYKAKDGTTKTTERTTAIPVQIVSYPGGVVTTAASEAIEAKATQAIVKVISEAPGGKLAVAELSRVVNKSLNGDPDKAGILAKVADKNFLKGSKGFAFDGLTLSL